MAVAEADEDEDFLAALDLGQHVSPGGQGAFRCVLRPGQDRRSLPRVEAGERHPVADGLGQLILEGGGGPAAGRELEHLIEAPLASAAGTMVSAAPDRPHGIDSPDVVRVAFRGPEQLTHHALAIAQEVEKLGPRRVLDRDGRPGRFDGLIDTVSPHDPGDGLDPTEHQSEDRHRQE